MRWLSTPRSPDEPKQAVADRLTKSCPEARRRWAIPSDVEVEVRCVPANLHVDEVDGYGRR